MTPVIIKHTGLIGSLTAEVKNVPLDGAVWYTAQEIGDGLEYRFAAGMLYPFRFLCSDMILDGDELGVFQLALQEGKDGPKFELYYGMLNQCQARMRASLEGVNQNRWQFPREAAWLKPMCGGDRVSLERVDRMTITVLRKGDKPVRWCMTDIIARDDDPPRLEDPILLNGPLLDEMGQNALRDWPGKTSCVQKMDERLKKQSAEVGSAQFPDGFSRWGGWKAVRFEATGRFRTHHDGSRWWLVDPDGYIFWSAGMDCVRVDVTSAISGLEKALAWLPSKVGEYAAAYETTHEGRNGFTYLAANFIRTFGPECWSEVWAKISLSWMRGTGFNTVANWSEWKIAKTAGFPYVRPLEFSPNRARPIFRDFPDVFDPQFTEDAADFSRQLEETAEDPAFIGYFLMNEPTWGFARQTPAEGMLFNTLRCHTRRALGRWLREKYTTDQAISEQWGIPVSFAEVAEGKWTKELPPTAEKDMEEFSGVMVERLFTTLSDACRTVDPGRLNLGARYYTVPPAWALAGMASFDVFSMNCYNDRVPEERVADIVSKLQRPVMIGEWHFGALDVGLPGSGIGRVKDQADRGKAYRVYLENAAVQPGCIGTHYFTLYDESALGRFDGENWNIGFIDVCNKPYEPMVEAARSSHARMYRVALGEEPPFADAPEYLPKLFL